MSTSTQIGGAVRDRALRLLEKTGVGCHTSLYRRTEGRVGERFRGAPVLLLTTSGRKTGKARTTPLLYLATGD